MSRTDVGVDAELLGRVERQYPGRARTELVEFALRALVETQTGASLAEAVSVRVPEPTSPLPVIELDGAGEVALPARYRDCGLIGRGGMGEVRRVHDREFNRTLAMKIILPRSALLEAGRFIEEAQVSAQLQHPGIVPVHDFGQLPDGRLWFTMKEVRGRTLEAVIAALHGAATARRFVPTGDGWTFRRLVDAFQRLCEAVAYAHSRGVVHRDLKPQNMMIGEFGEVFVMDWGLAKPLGAISEPVVSSARQSGDLNETQYGRVIGTPSYMPPEQARGDVDAICPASDVFALGAVLYQVLSGSAPVTRPARAGSRVDAPPVETVVPPHVPDPPPELAALCRKAMAHEPRDRFQDAGEMSAALAAWLDGASRRERALECVDRALLLEPSLRALRAEVEALRTEAARVLAPLPDHAPASEKAVAWRLEDQSAEPARRLLDRQTVQEQLLRDALGIEPDLPEARRLLADLYRNQLESAEARRDVDAALHWEPLLRAYDNGRHEAWLRGDGRVSLRTEPREVNAEVLRFVARDRRLVAEPVRSATRTPIEGLRLPRGSYLLRLSAPGHCAVDYPVSLERAENWDGCDPDGRQVPIRLPLEGELSPDDVYVPAGWFWSGGDPIAQDGLPRRRVWVDAFVMRRYPVTFAEYQEFLEDLADRGLGAQADELAPRIGGPGIEPRFVRGETIAPEGAGSDSLRWPVTSVHWFAACAYARWLAARDGVPWRLPHELEWEKAARGVDGRFFPWGDQAEPTWTCVLNSRPTPPRCVPVDALLEDVSPYGIVGLAGNARALCSNDYRRDGPHLRGGRIDLEEPVGEGHRALRGGAWAATILLSRAAGRFGTLPHQRLANSGLRLVRSVPTDPPRP